MSQPTLEQIEDRVRRLGPVTREDLHEGLRPLRQEMREAHRSMISDLSTIKDEITRARRAADFVAYVVGGGLVLLVIRSCS